MMKEFLPSLAGENYAAPPPLILALSWQDFYFALKQKEAIGMRSNRYKPDHKQI